MGHRNGIPKNRRGKRWSQQEISMLKKFAWGNTPTPLIADAIGRTEDAIRNMASEISITLKPVNRSPFNRRKKK